MFEVSVSPGLMQTKIMFCFVAFKMDTFNSSMWCWVNGVLCVQCYSVMAVSSDDRCAFVKRTPDCKMTDGFINYLQVAFCLLPPSLTPLTITLCVRSADTSNFA